MRELFAQILAALLSNPYVIEQLEPEEIIQAALNYTALAAKGMDLPESPVPSKLIRKSTRGGKKC